MNGKQLFGGALMAAGVSVAAAGDFTGFTQASGNYTGAYFGGFSGFSINGFYNNTSTSGASIAIAEGTATSFLAYGFDGGTGLAYAIHFNPIAFGVDADTAVQVSWDFTGDEGPGGAYIDSYFSIDGPGGNLAAADLNTPVGSTTINLVAGETYTILGTALAAGGGTSFFSMVIPAPGAIALLGMAGLVGRRRRRE